jgi:hypothetical protein
VNDGLNVWSCPVDFSVNKSLAVKPAFIVPKGITVQVQLYEVASSNEGGCEPPRDVEATRIARVSNTHMPISIDYFLIRENAICCNQLG